MGTDEAQTKLVLHPASWLKTTLTYQWTDSDYYTTTDPASGALVSPGGQVLAGRYQANVYGLGLTVIPSHRLYFSGTFTFSNSRVTTWAQGVVPSIVVPCQGNIYSVIAGVHYTLNERTSVQAAYSFSQAGYGQNNYDGLPLGIDYTRNGLTVGVTRQITKSLSSNLRYQFYDYRQPSSGGVNNFTAQGVFATLMFAWR
jgi:hypothetical protein